MKELLKFEIAPDEFDWKRLLLHDHSELELAWQAAEMDERAEDLAELRWLLQEIRKELELYRNAFPDGRFERELESAFARQADVLERQVAEYETKLERCDLNAYLTVKYDIRTLYKQLGATVAGSDWQSPCKKLQSIPDPTSLAVPEESGFAQEEEGTYMRSYGSEAVKEYEEASLEAFYTLPAERREQRIGFVTTSGMKALELAMIAYRSFTGETNPFYYQKGFYCEGADLAKLLLNAPQELEPDELYKIVDENRPIGCVLVDPGMCWPISPAVDLARLMDGLSRHRQSEPLYVIVDRTLTSVSNPLFERYGDQLPPHVVLISVESGIKYMQYGLDLANVGYLTALGRMLESQSHRAKWVALLSLLDAGADPVTVRQLPTPDLHQLTARLSRLNRNAYWMDAFLRHMVRVGKVEAYYRSVEPSPQYELDGRHWIGSLFYIQLPGLRSDAEYEAWIDAFVISAPREEHFVSGGSFGFDTFRMNAVRDSTCQNNALRVSVGRAPLGQFLLKLKYMYSQL